MTDYTVEELQVFFWKALAPDVGAISEHIKNLLNFTGLAANAALSKLTEPSNIARLQTMIRDKEPRIEKYCSEKNIPVTRYLPDWDEKSEFCFSFADELLITEIAQKVGDNGLQRYLPPMAGTSSTGMSNSEKGRFNEQAEATILLSKLRQFYNSSPPDDILRQYFERINCLEIKFKREAGAKVAAYVRCGLCREYGTTASNRAKEIKALRDPRYSWPIRNLTNHYNGHRPKQHSESGSQGSRTAIIDSLSVDGYQMKNVHPTQPGMDLTQTDGSYMQLEDDEACAESTVDGNGVDLFEKTSIGLEDSSENNNHSLDQALENAPVLSIMSNMHKKNLHKKPGGRRYSPLEKDMCAYEYLTTGNAHYEYENNNASIASTSTISRYLKKDTIDIKEGEINVFGLKKYLTKNGFPMVVALCEDGTRITPAVQFDCKSDSLRGLVAPFDCNGLPEANLFRATTPYKMKEDIKNYTTGNYAYVQMAVPLCKNAAPFVLYHACSDNRFSAAEVEKRLVYTEQLLKSEGILVVSNASDGDTRLLKFMKKREGLDNVTHSSRWGSWFIANDCIDNPICVQDMTHTVNKLRNRLAHSKKRPDMIIGDYTITTEHLKELIRSHSKDKHLLNMSDVNVKDKMKFKPTLKLMNPDMIAYLEEHIDKSNGTVLFLNIMRRLYRSYSDETLLPSERLLENWIATLIVRAWWNWCGDTYKHLKHFITTNAYACIEINAHALIKFILVCREKLTPENFLIHALSSQPCERLFGQLRSMGATNQTVVNFTIKEFTDKLKRFQLKNNIMYRNHEKVHYPYIENLKGRKVPHECLSDSDITDIIKNAFAVARVELARVGIHDPNFTASMNFRYRNALHFVDVGRLNFDVDRYEDDENSPESIDYENVSDVAETEDEFPFEFACCEFVENSEDDSSLGNEFQAGVNNTVYDLSKILPKSRGSLKIPSSRTGDKHTFKVIDFNNNVISLKKEYLVYLMTPGRFQLSADRQMRFKQRE